MDKPPNPRKLHGHLLRALNKARKPSTAEEITEMLNLELGLEDKPFTLKEVADQLSHAEDFALTLYWLRARPRK